MFAKSRRKKEFPPGTFIPKPARIMAILQLCVAFTLVFWTCSLPFMGDLFTYKSKMLLYQDVMGDSALLQKLDAAKAEQLKSKLERNSERFKQLPRHQRLKILEGYNSVQKLASASFFEKLQKSALIFLFGLPPIELAWLILAVAISILLLLKIEGASHAAWLLPIIVLAYAFDNQFYGKSSLPSPDEALFPSEQVIVNNYLREPLSSSIKAQHEQLAHGWQRYLIQEWAKQTPSENVNTFQGQAEAGEYAFNVARAEAMAGVKEQSHFAALRAKESVIYLFIYFLWNFYFAWVVNRKKIYQTA